MSQYSLPDSSYDVNGSNRMIQNQMQLSNNMTAVIQRLDEIEHGQQALMKNQEHMLRTLNQIVKKISDRTGLGKKPPIQRLQRIKSRTPSASDVSKLLHLPKALQKNISKFTENMLFTPTHIPDELIESGCLDEDECSAITSKTNYKDQIRTLIRKIKARGPKVIEKFLEIVGKDHPYLPQEVNKSLEIIVNESKKNPVCVICVMKSIVDLKDVGDGLWEAEIISDDIYEDLTECDNIHRNRPILWDNITNSINSYEQPEKALDTLLDALEPKYDYLVNYLRETPERPSLNCSCCRRRRVRSRLAWPDCDSISDISTTSEVPKQKIPKTIYGDTASDDSQSITSSQDLSKLNARGVSFDNLDRYDSIGSCSDGVFSRSSEVQNSTVSSTIAPDVSNNNSDDRSRHSSGHFVPKDQTDNMLEGDESNRSLPYVNGQSNSFYDDFADHHERPELKHSISTHSTMTVVERSSTPSGEATVSTSSYDENQNRRSSQSTDGLVSPDVGVKREQVDFNPDKDSTTTNEITKESEKEEPLYVRQKAYRRRRRKSSSDAMDGDSSEDNEAFRYLQRARQRRYQRKKLARQRSIPQEDNSQATMSPTLPDQKEAYVGVRSQDSRMMSKQKQMIRRQRSQGKVETTTDAEGKVSESVDTDTHLKKPLDSVLRKDFSSPEKDDNQTEAFLQVPEVYSSSSRAQVVKSDTDIRIGNLSDTVAYSDFTA